jgi:prevent-host-death family protein
MNTQKFVPAGEFKQKCLALMDEVAALGTELVITKHGTPICKLMPLPINSAQQRFGWLKGAITIHGDLTEPTGTFFNH